MMEAVRTSETSVVNHFTRQYIPEDNSEQTSRDSVRLYLNAEINYTSLTSSIQIF
jgi:hypothetical protein